ncbi:hypothetical protein CMV_024941 [Castanea mollissima]|uniref:Uncharacterized protein n=1 Tax=Castanea mollissima TaxID=60419 RepID=A0A8J4QA06_9ROSI|nr:hypothetical protein CMV_024941 [Castanea mollissima]
MGKPSSLTSPTPLAYLVLPFISSSAKPESLRLVSCSGSDGISSNSLTVAGIEAGFNTVSSDSLTVVEIEVGFNMVNSDSLTVAGIEAGFNTVSSDSLTVAGIEAGFNTVSSDSLTVAGIEARFYSGGLKVRPMVGFNGCHDMISSVSTAVDGLEFGTSSKGLVVAPMEIKSGGGSDDFTLVLGKINTVTSQLSKGIFLVDILKRLLVAGFVDFDVNRVAKVGSECSVLLFQGADNKGTRLLDMGMALTMDAHNTLDVSKWVKNRIPGFCRVIGRSVNRHEKLCIAYLQRLEREMVVINQQWKKAAANQIVAPSMGKGKRELRNLISMVNYDGR